VDWPALESGTGGGTPGCPGCCAPEGAGAPDWLIWRATGPGAPGACAKTQGGNAASKVTPAASSSTARVVDTSLTAYTVGPRPRQVRQSTEMFVNIGLHPTAAYSRRGCCAQPHVYLQGMLIGDRLQPTSLNHPTARALSSIYAECTHSDGTLRIFRLFSHCIFAGLGGPSALLQSPWLQGRHLGMNPDRDEWRPSVIAQRHPDAVQTRSCRMVLEIVCEMGHAILPREAHPRPTGAETARAVEIDSYRGGDPSRNGRSSHSLGSIFSARASGRGAGIAVSYAGSSRQSGKRLLPGGSGS